MFIFYKYFDGGTKMYMLLLLLSPLVNVTSGNFCGEALA